MILYAARHAEVSARGLCYGRHDVATAIDSADAARAILQNLGPETKRVNAVWSSPVSRCRGPAALIAAKLDIPLRESTMLHEVDYGDWEGQRWDTLEREDSNRLRHWMQHWQTEAPPGGETVASVEQRVRKWLEEVNTSGLLVGHAGVIRALSVITRGSSWEQAMDRVIPHLEMDRFELSIVEPGVAQNDRSRS